MRLVKTAVISLAVISAIAQTACGSDSSGPGSSGFQVDNVSTHEPASATTSSHLACTETGEPTNFPYFSLGKTYGGEDASGLFRDCHPSATEHLVHANTVTYSYGPCELIGGGGDLDDTCSVAYTITSSPACQLNYSWYHHPRGSNHVHSRLKTWRNGAISVKFFDLGETHVYTGTSTIQLHSGHGASRSELAKALTAIREEPEGKPLGEPAGTTSGPVGIDSLPAPAPGAMQGKLRCDA
jgi:hypothetical protein